MPYSFLHNGTILFDIPHALKLCKEPRVVGKGLELHLLYFRINNMTYMGLYFQMYRGAEWDDKNLAAPRTLYHPDTCKI